MKLVGHMAPLVDVKFNSKDYQIISCSEDKVIKIWDIRTYKCIQTLHDKSIHRPDNVYTAMLFDSKNTSIVTASSQLQKWPMKRTLTDFKREYKGHRIPIIKVMYNELYKQAITVDDTTVCTWDIMSGELLFKFSVEKGIIACCFDNMNRRIITTCPDGEVLVWNYANGLLLKVCENSRHKSDL
jgi:WD40 repeat protein